MESRIFFLVLKGQQELVSTIYIFLNVDILQWQGLKLVPDTEVTSRDRTAIFLPYKCLRDYIYKLWSFFTKYEGEKSRKDFSSQLMCSQIHFKKYDKN